MLKSLIVVIAVFASSAIGQDDLCGLPSCNGATHIDCLGTEQFAEACFDFDSFVMLDLAPVKDQIVAKHNVIRNGVASGREKFLAATHMATMRWNVPLANLARKNVKQCTFQQDECRNTLDYNFVGQNIARAVFSSTDTRRNIDIILELIELWNKERNATTVRDIRKFPQPDGTRQIANFCQMVRDYSDRVGCGALKYTQGTNSGILLTCNYNVANAVDWEVYNDGPLRSKCTTGANPTYPNLCSESEVYNANEWWL